MKKRNIIIVALAALTLLSACRKTKAGSEIKAENKPTPAVTTTPEPLPEPGTVVLDPEKGISASLGVAEGDGAPVEDEEPKETTAPTPTPAVTPTATPTETPAPTPTPTAAPTATPTPEEPAKTEYEVFLALSPEEKDNFLNSFESYEAFFEWLLAAQEEYKNAHPDIEIGPGGTIDLSQLGK